ncbi:MAG: S8 family serine peptidase [Prevotella sp.]|nr:S8 family serine peptidase [Prevotella sp.]
MRRLWLLAVVLLGCVALMAEEKEKLSHHIRQLITQDAHGRRAMGVTGEKVCAFVRFTTTDGEGLLAAYGCEKVSQIGDIYIANIPVEQIAAMAASDQVERIEANLSGKLTNDRSPLWVDNTPVYSGTGLPEGKGYDGTGVLLGIVDLGFDVTHPAFYSTDGSTYRIKAFVDENANKEETRGVKTPLGREYTTQEDILNNRYVGDSLANHATHCLGTAAGSGYGTPYRGVAYGADIFAISSRNAGYDYLANSADQTARMKRIFDYAEEHRQPCVITYSIGFDDVPGDTQLFREALDLLVGPGRILVTSAGNSGDEVFYVDKSEHMATAGVALPYNSRHLAHAYMKSEQPFRLKCLVCRRKAGEGSTYELADSVVFDSANLPTDSLVMRGHHLLLQRSGSFYTLSARTEKQERDTLLLAVESADGAVEMYASTDSPFENITEKQLPDARFRCGVMNRSVGLPGCLQSAVTVGALNGRPSFVNTLGQTIASWGMVTKVGTIAAFSSVGPTRDGLPKPDIVAPGVNVLSAGNSYCPASFDESMVATTTFNGRQYPWLSMSGTSMSGPCVAGIVALWLQADPTLTPDRVKEVFKATSKRIEVDGQSPNNVYGYGLIDAYAGLREVLKTATGIERVENSRPDGDRWYTMQGTLLNGKPARKGVYVHQGRKLMVK